MVITPQVALSYSAEFWDKAKPVEGYELMEVQAAIAHQALQGYMYAFVDSFSENTFNILKQNGYKVEYLGPEKCHIRW